MPFKSYERVNHDEPPTKGVGQRDPTYPHGDALHPRTAYEAALFMITIIRVLLVLLPK